MQNTQNLTTHWSDPNALHRSSWRVVFPWIHSTISVSLSCHLHDDCISWHVIVSALLLIRQIWKIHITQKNFVFLLDTTLHRTSIYKRRRILQVYVFEGHIQILPQLVTLFPNTNPYSTPFCSKNTHLLGALTPSVFFYLRQLGLLFVRIEHVTMTSRYNPNRALFRAVRDPEVLLNTLSTMLELFVPRVLRTVYARNQKYSTCFGTIIV